MFGLVREKQATNVIVVNINGEGPQPAVDCRYGCVDLKHFHRAQVLPQNILNYMCTCCFNNCKVVDKKQKAHNLTSVTFNNMSDAIKNVKHLLFFIAKQRRTTTIALATLRISRPTSREVTLFCAT